MKKTLMTLVFAVALTIAVSGLAFAASCHGDHSATGDRDHPGMGHSHRTGELLREAMVEGYRFEYRLIDIRERVKGVEGMEKMTHHMMLYVMGQGKVNKIKVGFLIEGPDGAKQMRMAMTMGEGSGTDVSFTGQGAYKVMTKAIVDGRELVDRFEYEVK